jgi:hypothetical protein
MGMRQITPVGASATAYRQQYIALPIRVTENTLLSAAILRYL